jgi:MoxR-like ATPase
VLDAKTVLQLQHIVRRIPVADHVIEYAMRLVRATRVTEPDIPEIVRNFVSWGAGPRACQNLVLGGKARAVLHGRYHVATEDIAAVAKPVLRHRLVTNFNADAEGITTDKLVEQLIQLVPAKEGKVAAAPEVKAVLQS